MCGLKEGFYTALGTPLAEDGMPLEKSLQKEIESQLAAGASGLLLLGTMGMQGCLKEAAYEDTIRIAADVSGREAPLMVGIFDNSLARVRERIEVSEKYSVDAVVLTAPYYFQTSPEALYSFFHEVAKMTKMPVVLYDHPPITKHKITFPMAERLAQEPNIVGIKSADFLLIKALHDDPSVRKDFTPIFSHSDLFVPAHQYGIHSYLDGIFSCMPKSIGKVDSYLRRGVYGEASVLLNQMMAVRDKMLTLGIWSAFSCAMNFLGLDGNFAPDYERVLINSEKEQVKCWMESLGETPV